MNRLIAIMFLGSCMSCALGAATFTVTNFDDTGAGSLRQAMVDAEAASGADVIEFDSALIHQYPATITLQTALPQLADDVEINGPGRHLLTVTRDAAAPAFAVIDVSFSSVAIRDITLDNGLNESAAGTDAEGGGVSGSTGSDITLENVVISNCLARSLPNSGGDGGGAFGGGLYNQLATTLRNVTFLNCGAQGGDSDNNTAGNGLGGAAFLSGSSDLSDVRALNCYANGGNSLNGDGGGGTGGGFYFLSSGTFAGLYAESCTCLGGTGATSAGNASSGGMVLSATGQAYSMVTARNCVVTGGASPGGTIPGGGASRGGIGFGGSAISDVEVDSCEAVGGGHPTDPMLAGAADAAGMLAGSATAVQISRAYIHDCSCTTPSVEASALRISGDAVVTKTAIVDNACGGVSVGVSTSTVEITQSTIHGNVGEEFGGVYLDSNVTGTLTNVTVTGNQCAGNTSGGGIFAAHNTLTTINLFHCIVNGNFTAGATSSPDLGAIGDWNGSQNLIGVGDGQYTNGVNGNQVGDVGAALDPDLGPLQDNGGFSPSCLPQPGSPVIDAGAVNGIGAPSQDQRGAPRHVGGGTPSVRDLGAVEAGATAPSLIVSPPSASLDSDGPETDYLLTGSNLDGLVRVYAPSGIGVSNTAGGPFVSYLEFVPTGGNLSETVYVRYLGIDDTISASIRHESTRLPDIDFTVSATYLSPPHLSLRFGDGPVSVIQNGGSHVLTGAGPGNATGFTYTINNLGEQDLLVNGAPSVQFSNQVNCTVTLKTPPPGVVAPNVFSPFEIEVTPAATGAYGFQMVIPCNDPAASMYTVNVSGQATSGSSGGGGGDDDEGCSTGEGRHGWLFALALPALLGVAFRRRRA